MVNGEIIWNILDKCLTNHQIQEKLSLLSQDEKNNRLRDLLNPFEWEEYTRIVDEHKFFNEELWEDIFDSTYDDEYDRLLFNYEKRIFNHSKKVNVKSIIFDDTNFKEDKQTSLYNFINGVDEDIGVNINKLSPIEKNQVLTQREINLTKHEFQSCRSYFGDMYELISKKIHYPREYEEQIKELGTFNVDKKVNSVIRALDNCISKSGGLLENTILYRGGFWDIHLNPGDSFKLKGYTSFSFQKKVGENFQKRDNDNFLIKAYVRKGVKGLCGTTEDMLSLMPQEHEYLLGRNSKGTVLGYDYNKRIVYIVIDE